MSREKQAKLFAPPKQEEDCCITAAHRADERFRRSQLMPDDNHDSPRSLPHHEHHQSRVPIMGINDVLTTSASYQATDDDLPASFFEPTEGD